jgi:hypothetical protein
MFIAAGAKIESLEIAEKRHRCPSLASIERGLDAMRLKNPGKVANARTESGRDTAAELGDQLDLLLKELTSRESDLDRWIRTSDANAAWFRKDPVGAMRAANLGIDEKILRELERVTAAIAQKLKAEL